MIFHSRVTNFLSISGATRSKRENLIYVCIRGGGRGEEGRDARFNNGVYGDFEYPPIALKEHVRLAVFNFIRDVSPRVSSLLRGPDFFFLPALAVFRVPLRTLSLSLSYFLVRIFSPFSTFLSIFSSPPFPPSFSSRSLSLFHFSIAEGKIIRLSATFLVLAIPVAVTCRCTTLPCSRRRRPLGSFSLVSRERYVSRRGPCPKTM